MRVNRYWGIFPVGGMAFFAGQIFLQSKPIHGWRNVLLSSLCFVVYLILADAIFAYIGDRRFGWKKLSQRFATEAGEAKPLWKKQSIEVQDYIYFLTIGYTPTGLYLQRRKNLFFPGHESQLIPWSDVETLDRGYICDATSYLLGKEEQVRIMLKNDIADSIDEARTANFAVQ